MRYRFVLLVAAINLVLNLLWAIYSLIQPELKYSNFCGLAAIILMGLALIMQRDLK